MANRLAFQSICGSNMLKMEITSNVTRRKKLGRSLARALYTWCPRTRDSKQLPTRHEAEPSQAPRELLWRRAPKLSRTLALL